MNEINETQATPAKEIAEGSIEVTQEVLDQHPHLVTKFGCKVGDVITTDRLDPNTEVPAFAPEAPEKTAEETSSDEATG